MLEFRQLKMTGAQIAKLGRFSKIGHRITGIRNHERSRRAVGSSCTSASTTSHASRTSRSSTTRRASRPPRSCAVAWFAEQDVRVRRVMTDNGAGYVAKDFAVALAAIRAKHIRTRPYTPRTNGKAERFIQTMLREWAYTRPYTNSVRRYNERRPHGGIGGAPLITRLQEAA